MQPALRRLPIGIDDFKEIITADHYYVDKSLFIKEVLENVIKGALIPRPRRFGKTLNMSMLRYFFEKSELSQAYLFEELKIASHTEVMKHQGQYPVIFLTLKFSDKLSWEESFSSLKRIVAAEYQRHRYLLASELLQGYQKDEFKAIIALKAETTAYEVSLKNLIFYLSDYHKKAPIVLIDEYDVPIHGGFLHGYYEKAAAFTRGFLGDAFKGNSALGFAVVTGAMRVTKESIFTGMNNFEVFTFLDPFFSETFGLLESEVAAMLSYYGMEADLAVLQAWYNGYQSGPCTVYNPWSILNFIKHHGTLRPYWINTSGNDIIKSLLEKGSADVKKDLERLLLRETIKKPLCEDIVFSALAINSEVLWTFLFSSGYLTFNKVQLEGLTTYVDFKIPNAEVAAFFERTILGWFPQGETAPGSHEMLKSLISGDIATFTRIFKDCALTSFSYFDVTGKEPEKFYHAFVLGLLVTLSDRYEIKSNRESGYGRYDVMLLPRDTSALGIVIEFKSVDVDSGDSLEVAVAAALRQIEEKRYIQELLSRGIATSLAIAIAFKGKELRIAAKALEA